MHFSKRRQVFISAKEQSKDSLCVSKQLTWTAATVFAIETQAAFEEFRKLLLVKSALEVQTTNWKGLLQLRKKYLRVCLSIPPS